MEFGPIGLAVFEGMFRYEFEHGLVGEDELSFDRRGELQYGGGEGFSVLEVGFQVAFEPDADGGV